MRKKLATIEGVERTVNIKDKVIETMQEVHHTCNSNEKFLGVGCH